MRSFSRQIITLVVAGLVGFFAGDAPGQTTANSQEGFPLTQGTSWTYRGIVRWAHGNSEKSSQARVTWKTEIFHVIRREHLVAAVVNGLPSDLDWSTGQSVPADSLIIQSDTGEIYIIGHDQTREALARLQDKSDSLQDFLKIDDIFLRFPLEKSKKFCDPESMARDDGMYCLVVSSVERVALNDIKGLPPATHDVYELRYQTNPDDTTYQIVPGVGIISYEYHHHGTVADTELKLVEFHPGT